MGRFKQDAIDGPNKENNVFYQWLMTQGFRVCNGARGEKGLTKIYLIEEGLSFVWVTINLDKKVIYVYKEYECSGMLGEDEITIEPEWFISLDTFVEEIDKELGRWIDEDG